MEKWEANLLLAIERKIEINWLLDGQKCRSAIVFEMKWTKRHTLEWNGFEIEANGNKPKWKMEKENTHAHTICIHTETQL